MGRMPMTTVFSGADSKHHNDRDTTGELLSWWYHIPYALWFHDCCSMTETQFRGFPIWFTSGCWASQIQRLLHRRMQAASSSHGAARPDGTKGLVFWLIQIQQNLLEQQELIIHMLMFTTLISYLRLQIVGVYSSTENQKWPFQMTQSYCRSRHPWLRSAPCPPFRSPPWWCYRCWTVSPCDLSFPSLRCELSSL